MFLSAKTIYTKQTLSLSSNYLYLIKEGAAFSTQTTTTNIKHG